MISILIPTYNYNVYPLVREVHKQFDKTGVPFEIRVYDDASNASFEQTPLIPELSGVVYKQNEQNLGRLATRYRLAQDARYDWLLFMDADVFPTDRFFASKLLKTMEQNQADVYFGGINVPENPPAPDKTLRWKYGKYRESKSLNERLKMPYQSLLCGTLTVKKQVFLQEAQVMLPIKKYGLDVLFSHRLKLYQRKIHHFNNPVTHLGLENNQAFLDKTQQALETFKYLIDKKLLPKDYLNVTAVAYKLKRFCPNMICRFKFKIAAPLIKLNLLSKQPALKLFDFYKLLYFSQLK